MSLTDSNDILAERFGLGNDGLSEDGESISDVGTDGFLAVLHVFTSISAVGWSLKVGNGLINISLLGHDSGEKSDGISTLLASPLLGGGALAHIHSHLTTWLLLGEEESVQGGGNSGPVFGNSLFAHSWVSSGGASGGDQDGDLLGKALLSGQVLLETS